MKLPRTLHLPGITVAMALQVFFLATPAAAVLGDIAVQTQVQYQLFEVKPVGQEPTSLGGLSTTYNIQMRRPIFPFLKLNTNLNMTSSENSDRLGQQQSRHTSFSASARELRHTLRFGMDENRYNSFSSAGGTPSISSGLTRSYYGNFMWQEPKLPVVNLQYRRNTNEGRGGSQYQTSSWIFGTYHDLAPFRLTYDRTSQSYNFTGTGPTSTTDTVRSRAGITLDQRLMPGLSLYGIWSEDSSESKYSAGRTTSQGGSYKSARLSATPTRSMFLTAERSYVDSDFNTGLRQTSSNSTTTSYMARAEVLPGLSLVATKQLVDQPGIEGAGVSSDVTSASLSALLTPDVAVTLGWNSSDFSSAGTDTGQDSYFGSLQMPLTPNTYLTADVGMGESDVGGALSHRGRYAGVLVRNRSRQDLSLGLGYRWNWLMLGGVEERPEQTDQNVDLTMSWLPARNIGVNATASYRVSGGRTISESISPNIDLRWEPSNKSQILLRYGRSKLDQFDFTRWVIVSQDTNVWTGRLSYNISRDSSLDVSYDYFTSNTGIEWQRSLRMYYTFRL